MAHRHTRGLKACAQLRRNVPVSDVLTGGALSGLQRSAAVSRPRTESPWTVHLPARGLWPDIGHAGLQLSCSCTPYVCQQQFLPVTSLLPIDLRCKQPRSPEESTRTSLYDASTLLTVYRPDGHMRTSPSTLEEKRKKKESLL